MNNLRLGFEQIKDLLISGNRNGMSKRGFLELYGKCKVLEYKCLMEKDSLIYEVQSLIYDLEKELI